MKQGKLIRRAVSAALAGCMMFTFSAPALAESTDALMQLSMTRRSAVSVLDAENGDTVDYGITITITGREVKVDSSNCDNILGFLKYDPDEQKLTLLKSNASAVNYLTIDAPNTDVVLESTEMIVSNNLLIENARSVKVSSTGNWAPVYGKVYIYCACPVTLEHTEAGANSGVAISGIEFAAPVNASDFVYYTSDAPDATPTDAGTGTIPARTENYLRIVPKVSYTITADDATITVDGKAVNSAFAGEKVTVTAAGKENAEFTGWTDPDSVLTSDQLTAKEVTFTMPGNNVTLNPNYKQYYTINSNDTAVIIKVDGTEAGKAFPGQTIRAWAPNKDGWEFEKWNATGVDLGNWVNKDWITFEMPESNVTLNPHYAKLHAIEVVNGTADITSAKEGTKVIVTANHRPGYVFDRWEVNNGDVAVAKKNEEETTFVMPDKPVTAVAKYKKLLGITVNSGKAYVEDAVTDAALKGKLVVIKADKIEGKRFDQWKIVSGNVILDNQRAPEARFTMPETAVEITALYNDLHAITVNNGTANVEEAVIGDTVKIKAESREGYVFDHWEVSYGDVAVANKNAKETTFTMPDSMVVLTAKYKKLQSITLENGKAYAGGEEITTAKKGTEVAIMADDLDGKVFDRWEIVSGNVTLENANKAKTTFTMPAESISLKAVYNTIHSIHTTFCTADPASAIVGTEITVTADERPGYVFDRWEASDGVELTEDGKFTMPDHDVTIEAKYKQYHSIEVSKGVATDAEGNPISSALEGTEIWIEIDREQRNPDEFEFKHWESGPEDLEIANRKAERTSFTMPDEDVTVEAKFLHLREITVHDGTTYVEGEEGGIAKAGQTVTVKADEIPGLKFDHWTVDSGNVTLNTVTIAL